MERLQINNLFPFPDNIAHFIFVFCVNADNNFASRDGKFETMDCVTGQGRHPKIFTDFAFEKTTRYLPVNLIPMLPQSYFENTLGTISQPTEINLVTGFVLR